MHSSVRNTMTSVCRTGRRNTTRPSCSLWNLGCQWETEKASTQPRFWNGFGQSFPWILHWRKSNSNKRTSADLATIERGLTEQKNENLHFELSRHDFDSSLENDGRRHDQVLPAVRSGHSLPTLPTYREIRFEIWDFRSNAKNHYRSSRAFPSFFRWSYWSTPEAHPEDGERVSQFHTCNSQVSLWSGSSITKDWRRTRNIWMI